MKYSIILFCLIAISCPKTPYKEDKINFKNKEKRPLYGCVKKGGENFTFSFDDFSSEGAEGKVFFDNDTLLRRIDFNYATSMVYVEQEYEFAKSKLIKFKNKTNYINSDKSDYSGTDSIEVIGNKIYSNNHFDQIIFDRILDTVAKINPCWIKKKK